MPVRANIVVFDYQSSLSQVTSCLSFLLGVRKEKFPHFEHCLRMDRKQSQISFPQQACVSALSLSLPCYLLLHWMLEEEVKTADSVGRFSQTRS